MQSFTDSGTLQVLFLDTRMVYSLAKDYSLFLSQNLSQVIVAPRGGIIC